MAEKMSDLKKEVTYIRGNRYAFPHEKYIIIRNMPDVRDLDMKNVVQRLVNEDLKMVGVTVVAVKRLNKLQQKSIIMAEIDTHSHRSDILKKKMNLKEKYDNSIFINADKSYVELKWKETEGITQHYTQCTEYTMHRIHT